MDSIINQIRALRAAQAEIEKRLRDDSLTLEQINELDGEWEILDAELSMYDDMLEAATALAQLEEVAVANDDDDEWWLNPTDEDVERWELERERTSGWRYDEEGTFDLANEV